MDSERYLELYINLTESGSNIHAVKYNHNLLHCVCLCFSMVLKRPTHAQPTTVERPMPNKVRFVKGETQILLSLLCISEFVCIGPTCTCECVCIWKGLA